MIVVTLCIAFLLNTVVYWYIGRNVVSQPRYLHPRLFWNPKILTVAVVLPVLGFVAITISGFILTDKGFEIMFAVVIAFVAFSEKPALGL